MSGATSALTWVCTGHGRGPPPDREAIRRSPRSRRHPRPCGDNSSPGLRRPFKLLSRSRSRAHCDSSDVGQCRHPYRSARNKSWRFGRGQHAFRVDPALGPPHAPVPTSRRGCSPSWIRTPPIAGIDNRGAGRDPVGRFRDWPVTSAQRSRTWSELLYSRPGPSGQVPSIEPRASAGATRLVETRDRIEQFSSSTKWSDWGTITQRRYESPDSPRRLQIPCPGWPSCRRRASSADAGRHAPRHRASRAHPAAYVLWFPSRGRRQ